MTRRNDTVALAAALPQAVPARQEAAIGAETMERLVIQGDLSKLTPAQRVEVYMARCDAAGLDARTQPFAYLSLQGKLTLYATKTATDQLVATRRLSVQIVDRRHLADAGLYEVIARVTYPDGRMVEDVGVVSINGLKGDAAANAIMKAITKAKRRAILSACGLGMLDETEMETIQGARLAAPEQLHAEVAQPVQPAQPAAVVEVVAVEADEPVQEPAREAVDAYVDGLDRQAITQEIGNLWRQSRMGPVKARAHLAQTTGCERVSDLSAVQLASYRDILMDEQLSAEGI